MKIKTRESLRSIKTFDRAENLAGKTKGGLSELNRQAEDVGSSTEESATDYAGNQVQGTEERTARLALLGAKRFGKWGVRETRKNIMRWKNRPKKLKASSQKQLPPPQRPALPAGKKTVKTAQNAAKTAKQTAKTAKATAKASAKAAKAAAKAAKAAAQATVKFVKVAVKAIIAATKAVIAAVKGIIAAIAAGGWVAVAIILVVCLIGGLIAGICSIFTLDEGGGYAVNYLMSVCENESKIYETEIIGNTPHDYLEISGEGLNRKDILAVYAVKTNSSGDDFTSADDKDQEKFREVYTAMYSVRFYTAEKKETVKRAYIGSDGKPYVAEESVTKIVLHIERNTISPWNAADKFSFNKKKREHLATLLSKDFDEMWAVLVD